MLLAYVNKTYNVNNDCKHSYIHLDRAIMYDIEIHTLNTVHDRLMITALLVAVNGQFCIALDRLFVYYVIKINALLSSLDLLFSWLLRHSHLRYGVSPLINRDVKIMDEKIRSHPV
ncbi:hypothetical protein BDB01DRAFT_838639 [Pilobolus umbonatus]|nr:hypothetical protein BDB01DRAFT_838639 [Pilobolus umbonatus]